ncbi:MAG: UbiX family flavin prenyltransferase [Candidatus Kryptonium sp.]|nr:UbiX family flavin prenyltransferase [Candidatus Kryptonium sp.]
MSDRRRIIIGVTGASGGIYAIRTIRAFLIYGFEVHLIISDYGNFVLKDECGVDLRGNEPMQVFKKMFGAEVENGIVVKYNFRDLAARISSGSFETDGMVVVPCSVKTLSGIANGISSNLIERSADVCLKENRPLVLVFRETPLNLIHIQNMLTLAQAGAKILPASPAFYQKPKTFEDLGDFIAGKVLSLFGIKHNLYKKWGEEI